MLDVETEVNKHRTIKDRDKLGMIIKEYKERAIQNAKNLTVAGQFNIVALKLQEIYDKLPAPKLIKTTGNTQNVLKKTATITTEEKTHINDTWKQRTEKTKK